MSVSTKAMLRALGGLLSVACVGYIVWRFLSTDAAHRLAQVHLTGIFIGHVLVAAAVYTGGLVLLAIAWWWLLSALANPLPGMLTVAAPYATSQFAKYLPGNVGQYIARHALLRRLQLTHAALLAALAIEAASLVVSALAWAAPAAHEFLGRMLRVPAWSVLVAVLLALCLALLVLFWMTRRTRLGQWIPLLRPLRLFGVLGMHVVFFGVMIAALAIVAHALAGTALSPWRLAGVATASWLAGFVVIGSPGGLGVREAVFVELLKGSMPESTALLLAAAFRAITFLGDLALFLLGLLVMAYLRKRKAGLIADRVA